MAKPAHKPTDENRQKAEQLASVGLPYRMIASLIDDGINVDTLQKHYAKELERGAAKACAKVGNALFKKCMDGDTASLIFWAKTRMQWKETNVTEIQSDSNKLEITVTRATRENKTKPN